MSVNTAICILLSCVGASYGATIVEVAQGNADLSTLVSAVVKAPDVLKALSEVLPNIQYTVFAPNNAAFAAVPKANLDTLLDPANVGALTSALNYHVIFGKFGSADLQERDYPTISSFNKVTVVKKDGAFFVNGAKVITPDVPADNGVVHIVDKFIVQTRNVVEVAVAENALSTFVAAVKAAQLDTALSGNGPFTIFAPSNAAFAELPKATLDFLLAPANKANLQYILNYHVVNEAFASTAIKEGTIEVDTNTKRPPKLSITRNNKVITVGGATVEDADLLGTNGFIHTINKVLIPAGFDPLSSGKTSDTSSTRASALFAMASLLLLALAHH
jgi:uncharacterized surface protein with fasciclin (FAS1) repeats